MAITAAWMKNDQRQVAIVHTQPNPVPHNMPAQPQHPKSALENLTLASQRQAQQGSHRVCHILQLGGSRWRTALEKADLELYRYKYKDQWKECSRNFCTFWSPASVKVA